MRCAISPLHPNNGATMATANGWTRLTNVLLTTLLGAATLGALDCSPDTPTSPLSVASPQTTALPANSESAPFYYYFGQKIDLQLDPTRLVVDDSEAATLVLGGNFAAARARIADGASAALAPRFRPLAFNSAVKTGCPPCVDTGCSTYQARLMPQCGRSATAFSRATSSDLLVLYIIFLRAGATLYRSIG